MKITKNNALAFAKHCLDRAESISNLLRTSIKVDSKNGMLRNYKDDFAELDQLKSLADKAMKLFEKSLPGYSFAENNESTITKIQLRESVVSVAIQLKSISAFLLKMIEKEVQQLIDKDYSLLLEKIDTAMKLVNGEVKIYKDESTWLLAEAETNYGKNESVRSKIGFKVPMLGRLVDALELQIQKESKENSAIDHTKLLINLVASLKSFEDDMKQYRSDPNAPVIQINKLLNKLTSASFSSNVSGLDIAAISVDEAAILMSESDMNIPNKLPDDRNELHKLILSVQDNKNLSYTDAFNLIRKK